MGDGEFPLRDEKISYINNILKNSQTTILEELTILLKDFNNRLEKINEELKLKSELTYQDIKKIIQTEIGKLNDKRKN